MASTVAVGALGAGLLAGVTPVSAVTGAGIIVSALVTPQDSLPHRIALRATRDAIDSDISITRVGNTIVITETEAEDGPSLALQAPSTDGVSCTPSSRSGLSEEIRCTFSGSTSARAHVFADFTDAPQGVTFGSDGSSDIQFHITGSAFDDYFEGGPRDDVIFGRAGDDFLIGGGGNDRLFGGLGDDVIYGDGEDGDGAKGNDWIEGGPGDDYIEGGPGVDSMWGGPGRDDINAKDGVADAVVDCNDNSSRGEDTEDLVFDVRLDRPIDCGINEAPESLTAPILLGSISPLTAGDRLTGVAATWRGTRPMTFSYEWEACVVAKDGKLGRCDVRASGNLKANGKDDKTGKDPQYQVTKSDADRIMRFVSVADNSKIRGGAKERVASNVSDVVEPAIFFRFPPWTMPSKQYMSNIGRDQWFFPTISDRSKPEQILPWLAKSAIAKHINITYEGAPRKNVPKEWRRDIRNGDVFDIVVDGDKVTPKNAVVEVSRKVKSDVVLRYWSYPLDTLDCGESQDWVKSQNELIQRVPTELTGFLKKMDDAGCTYELIFDDPAENKSARKSPVSVVRSVRVGASDPETGLAVLRINAFAPSPGGLALALGAPRGANIASNPGQPTISVRGVLPYFGPSVPFGAVWVGLIGDQARQPTVPTRVDIFELDCVDQSNSASCRASQFSRGQMGGAFSTNLTVPLSSGRARGDARVRILVTTFHDPTSKKADDGSLLPREQVFADVILSNCESSRCWPEDRMTLDGRCFDEQGRLTSCAAWPSSNPSRTVHASLASRTPSLATLTAPEAMRQASQRLDEGVRPVIVNGIFPLIPVVTYAARSSSVGATSSTCVWWDLPCVIKGMVTRFIDAVIKPVPPKGRPQAPAVSYRLGARVVYLAPGESILTVGNDSVLHVPGVGLIGLDGATLIGLDGATLIGLDGATLIGLDGATLIGLDGATLIGLDGATLAGRVPLALAPPRLLSDQAGS